MLFNTPHVCSHTHPHEESQEPKSLSNREPHVKLDFDTVFNIYIYIYIYMFHHDSF